MDEVGAVALAAAVTAVVSISWLWLRPRLRPPMLTATSVAMLSVGLVTVAILTSATTRAMWARSVGIVLYASGLVGAWLWTFLREWRSLQRRQ